MQRMKNEHAKFTNTIECPQMAASHCELHGFREILLEVFITKTIVFTDRFSFVVVFFVFTIQYSHSSEQYNSGKVNGEYNFIFAAYYMI